MILSIALSVIIFVAVAWLLLRLTGEAGVTLPGGKVMDFLTATRYSKTEDEKAGKYTFLKVFLYALLFRIIVFVLGWAAAGIFSGGSMPSFLAYCQKWNLWDAPHYLDIAEYGYAHHLENGQHLFLVFFPLYPLIVKIFAFVLRDYTVSALAVSFLSYSAGCALMYKLVRMDYSQSVARRSVIFLSVSPFAFFFGGVMTEGLFFLVITATFLAIRKHKWLLAGVLGALAALTRSVGVLMIIVAAVEWAGHERPIALLKEKNYKALGKEIAHALPLLIIPIGTLIYLYINYAVEGNAFAFMEYQKSHWSQELQYFGKTVKMLVSRVNMQDDWLYIVCIFLSGIVSIAVTAVITLLAVRRTRSMYTAFMIMYFFFNAAASWPLSLNRYMSCMIPAAWVLASLTEKRKNAAELITVCSAVLFGIFLAGYITGHSIM